MARRWERAGHPGTGESWEYVYDGRDRLRRATKKLNDIVVGSEEYWYDHKGARNLIVKRDASGTKTGMTWFIGGSQAHYDAAGALTRVYSHVSLGGGAPVARLERDSDAPSRVEYQFHGLADNTIAALDQMTGTINASFVYAPFGEIIEATDDGGLSSGVAAHSRRFNDKFEDDLTALTYYGFRYYDKTSMTWTQSDPLYRFAPDAAWAEPRRALLYTAHLNNPLRYLDPDGRDPKATLTVAVRDQTERDFSRTVALVNRAAAKAVSKNGKLGSAISSVNLSLETGAQGDRGKPRSTARAVTLHLVDSSDQRSWANAASASGCGGQGVCGETADQRYQAGENTKWLGAASVGGSTGSIFVDRVQSTWDNFSSMLGPEIAENVMNSLLENIVSHEAGHTLRLSHEEAIPGDRDQTHVMYGGVGDATVDTRFTEADKATMNTEAIRRTEKQ
jgi:RHS repeat-associated protein